ncbi:MAG: hypothetical protein AB7G25_07360 [Sphingomonadaceae bacterium]
MPLMRARNCAIAAAVITGMVAPAVAQHTEGDAASVIGQWGRRMAPPGTFWLDSNDDREVIRYTTPRDVRLCLPEPEGVGAADQGHSLRVTWDSTNNAILYPGNCLFFDARQVTVKPASNIPSGVTLRGSVETERALQK